MKHENDYPKIRLNTKFVSEFMRTFGLNQKELSAITDISVQSISALMNGGVLGTKTISKMAVGLKCSPHHLIDEREFEFSVFKSKEVKPVLQIKGIN